MACFDPSSRFGMVLALYLDMSMVGFYVDSHVCWLLWLAGQSGGLIILRRKALSKIDKTVTYEYDIRFSPCGAAVALSFGDVFS